ncbi:MAG TPA: hypothetical protein VNH18_35230, partial [Bryobacteraceae bacterium]|nr:hypothetical protein [Bryobacteraceae bacterium]
MRLSTIFLAGVLTVAAPFAASAGTYYLVTGQSSANTTIDADHLMQWTEPSSSQTCLVSGRGATCTSFTSAYFNPTFDWDLGGGDFTIKSNGADADITLSLFDGTVTGGPGGLTGSLIQSVTLASSALTNAYTATPFLFSTPATLLKDHHYIAILTSASSTGGNNQYDIKGIDTLS